MVTPKPPTSISTTFFNSAPLVFGAAILLRLVLMIYGRYQDLHGHGIKYTDIDYLVFTDAARFLSQGRSPYHRATYRYTPLLAWMLLPTTWDSGGWWFEFGKALFAAGDVVTGWLIWRVLEGQRGMVRGRALSYASLWLLNPMVANISTRGSSEGLLAVLVVAILWAVGERRTKLAGLLLGLGVHFKIYPFIYAASLWWWLGDADKRQGKTEDTSDEGKFDNFVATLKAFVTKERWELALFSLAAFMALNAVMYSLYGAPFIEHSYRYHFSRIDHRHNFSVYNTALHLSSMQSNQSGVKVESLAFIPQLFLSVLALPFRLAKKNLAGAMLAQTFAFVTFNKVCTSQYFLWYMVFLPFYLPDSSLMRKPVVGISALLLWVSGQALWLLQGYKLEFLGHAAFAPELCIASMLFFGINCWILGVIVDDIGSEAAQQPRHKARLGPTKTT